MSTWQELAAEKKRRQAASIPKEWLITLPADDVLDITGVPTSCGLLSARELEITEVSEIAILLNKLATGEWSSVEVTTAYGKRAVLAHQLVCPSSPRPGGSLISYPHCPDKLPHGDFYRPCPRESRLAR